MEWFRTYHGITSDSKWPLIARKSGQNIGTVVAIWMALLDHASQDDDRGSVETFDPEEIDALYGYEDGVCQRVMDAMVSKGMIADGCIKEWEKRQVRRERDEEEKERARIRARESRERKKANECATLTPPSEDAAPACAMRAPCVRQSAPACAPEQIREEKKREEIRSTPLERSEIQDRARALDTSGGRIEQDSPDSSPEEDPGIEFLELRQAYDERFRPEGPLAGFAEYKQLRASRQWPGQSRIFQDLDEREDAACWNPGFAPSLARYLRERTWKAPVKPRASPDDGLKSWSERRDEKIMADFIAEGA